jgi:hypothetical protein
MGQVLNNLVLHSPKKPPSVAFFIMRLKNLEITVILWSNIISANDFDPFYLIRYIEQIKMNTVKELT